jgi:hypothetical protein
MRALASVLEDVKSNNSAISLILTVSPAISDRKNTHEVLQSGKRIRELFLSMNDKMSAANKLG